MHALLVLSCTSVPKECNLLLLHCFEDKHCMLSMLYDLPLSVVQGLCGVPCTAAGDLKHLPIMCLHLMIWKTHKVRKMDWCPVLLLLLYDIHCSFCMASWY